MTEVLNTAVGKMRILGNLQMSEDKRIDEIIFAVTSANQSNSRYNPVPFYARAIQLDRFAQKFKKEFGVKYRIIPIPHFPPTNKFAQTLLKETRESTEDNLVLTPRNTIILCSTSEVIKLYQELGFAILPAELDAKENRYIEKPPIAVLRGAVENNLNWNENIEFKKLVAESSISVWNDFPEIPKSIMRIWRDPLLNESGDLTESRNYSAYASGMGRGTLIELKYKDIKESINPGKIVDEGCADGALLTEIALDFPDSDLIGIEITSEFFARCRERQRAGEFGGTFVYFHQRNLLSQIFEDNSIDSTICNSTTHEIWSYGNQTESLDKYINLKFKQLKPGGRLIIRDVVGPENKELEILLKANRDDGSNEDIFKQFNSAAELTPHLNGLSTHARFKRFAEDFLSDMRKTGRRDEGSKIQYMEEIIEGSAYLRMKLKDAVEFVTKKDYTENWQSELNEEFAFMSFDEWKKFLKDRGFRVIENPNEPSKSSRCYVNSWIVENRLIGKVEIFIKRNGGIEKMPYPPTNMVIVAEKPNDNE